MALDTSEGRVIFQMHSNDTASELWNQLPLDLVWIDYGGNEKICYLEQKLTPKPGPSYAGKQGDLCYYAPWGNLAVFTTRGGGPAAGGLIPLGRIESGGEALEKPGTLSGRLTRWSP